MCQFSFMESPSGHYLKCGHLSTTTEEKELEWKIINSHPVQKDLIREKKEMRLFL